MPVTRTRGLLIALALWPIAVSAAPPKKASAEHIERFTRIEEWSGSFSCKLDWSHSGDFTGPRIYVNDKPTAVQVKSSIKSSSRGTFTLERHQGFDYASSAAWSVKTKSVSGTHEERGRQDIPGGTVIEESEISVGPSPDPGEGSEVVLRIDPEQGTFGLSCPRGFVRTQRERKGRIPTMPENRTTEMFEGESLLACDISGPLPASGFVIKGTDRKEVTINPRLELPTTSHVECSYTLQPGRSNAEEVAVVAEPCACDGAPLHVRAEAPVGHKGGKWLKPELKTSRGEAPRLSFNAHGNRIEAVLEGDARKVGPTSIVFVYQKGGRTFRSAPRPVRFCAVEPPTRVDSPFRLVAGKDDYMFLASEPRLEIDLRGKAWVNGQDVSEELRWESDADWLRPKNMKGARPLFHADRMPDDNSSFGERQMRVWYQGDGCNCEGEVPPARVFFPRDGRANPEGKVPNWVYYWRQTSAWDGSDFEYAEKLPPEPGTHVNLTGSRVEAARYYIWEGVLRLSGNVVKRPCYERPDGTKDTGIDCFAVTVRHERRHMDELMDWWGPKMERYCHPNNPACPLDYDLDSVPNEVEDEKGCSKTSARSCPGRPDPELSDLEMTAYQAGWEWQTGAADGEDWACPGKQCPLGEAGP